MVGQVQFGYLLGVCFQFKPQGSLLFGGESVLQNFCRSEEAKFCFSMHILGLRPLSAPVVAPLYCARHVLFFPFFFSGGENVLSAETPSQERVV